MESEEAEQGRPLNYWGYCNALHFAPKASFTSCASYKNDYTYEFKNMVKQLHKKGIEVIMEMYFSGRPCSAILYIPDGFSFSS